MDSPWDLYGRVVQEELELRNELTIHGKGTWEAIVGEAADVANMAMMVADAWGWQHGGRRGILERERPVL